MVFYRGSDDNATASDIRHGACIAYIEHREVRMKKHKPQPLLLLVTVMMLTIIQFQDAQHVKLCIIYMLL